MSATGYGWIFAGIGIISVILNIVFIVFLFTKWSRFPRPTVWALSGFALFLVGQIGSRIIMMFMARFANTDSILMYNAIGSFLGSLLHFAGLCLLVTAVYVDRSPRQVGTNRSDAVESSPTREFDSNPYAV